MINFPDSPTLNQTFSASGKSWRWNGSAWQTVGGGSGGVTSYNDLTDKPTLGTAAATASTDYASAAQGAKADSALQPGTAIANIDGLQTALDGKQASGSYAPASGISPSAISGTAVVTSDPRLSDSRTPTAHKSSHATGGADALTPADIGAEPAISTLPIDKGGTGATTAEQARTNLGIKSPEIDRRIISSSTTWTKPAGARQILFECLAGGGGGGRGTRVDANQSVSGGAGGASGGYARVFVNAADLTDAIYTITIGSGGVGGTQPSGAAGGGTASNVSSANLGIFVNASGGAGGNAGAAGVNTPSSGAGNPSGNAGGGGSITGNGGGGAVAGYSATGGGAGGGCGTPSGGGAFQPFNGGNGGFSGTTSVQASGGGASTTGNGTNGGTTSVRPVPSLIINGGGGGGGGATTVAGASGGNGGNGAGFGSGGGGGGSVSAATGTGGNGGAGAPGVVVITTYL